MLNDDDKLMICRTLDNCWLFNLTKLNMCQEIFQTYNRVWNRLGGQLDVFWDNIAINHLSLNNSSMRSSFDTKLLLNRNTEQLIKSHFGQSGSMLNAIILPSNTSTATFDAQSASVFAVPSTDVEEPLLDTEEKETIS